MWALGKRGWPGGLPLVGEEGGAQLWELAFRLEPAEALGGLELLLLTALLASFGFDTQSLSAQGGQRRPHIFNRDRDNPQ